MGLHGRRKTYHNCLVLPISRIFFLVAHSIKTPQLSVLDLEQLWGQNAGKLMLVCGVSRQS
jgi:hypothetical protein